MGLVTSISGDLAKKFASIREIKERLIPNIPRDMAVFAVKEMVEHELNHGQPSKLSPVETSIGRISTNLARSWGFKKLNDYEWAVMQTQAIAPYAPDVFVYAQRRFGMTPFDSVRRRTHDFLMQGAKDGWEYAWKRIEDGKSYKYHPLYGE